ncbi:hypothetical protein [Flaviflexus huanghaiensis]|uniref:hypothetical protein n=1 Tax=Flaviflexus huanghaiensis TaxID=1111473 RepID=UPI0015FAB9B7|nr:hypothetical protein [Flaviflexus huanghaiensis]
MSTFRELARGPEQSTHARRFIIFAGLLLGGFTALLGTVTHSGGIDGGTTGLIVALLSVLLGSMAFTLFAGIPGWLGFGLGHLVTLAATSVAVEGDSLGSLSPELSRWWFYGGPLAIILGGLLAWLSFVVMSRVRLSLEREPHDME